MENFLRHKRLVARIIWQGNREIFSYSAFLNAPSGDKKTSESFKRHLRSFSFSFRLSITHFNLLNWYEKDDVISQN